MALEDRCSPQSANSPPGLPQSPQSNSHPFGQHVPSSVNGSPCPTTSMLMLINNVIDSKTKMNAMDYETSAQNGSLKPADMSPTHLLSTIASKNLFNLQNQLMFQQQQQHNSHSHSSANSEKHNSPPATPMRTDDEDEDEDEIDIENDTPKGPAGESNAKFLLPSPASPASSHHSPSPQISSPTSPTTTTPSGNLKFSISQILSDNFGIESKFHQHAMASAAAAMAQIKSGQHPLQQYPFYHPAAAAAMAAGMMPNGAHHPHFPHNLPPNHPLLYRPYDALDVEMRNQQAAVAQQKMMKNNFSSLFSSFQSQQQAQHQHQQQHQGKQGASRSSLEDFCDSKLSQLSNGGGSNGQVRPVISSNSSLSSSSSSVNNNHSKVTTTSTSAAIKSPSSVASTLRPDSGVDSSDDTKSETGSTKDENGQSWPAWIYCTRYSDRPSSGRNRNTIAIWRMNFRV